MEEYTKHVMAIRERRLLKIKPIKEMRKVFCSKCRKETYCNWDNINAFSLKSTYRPLFVAAMYVPVFKYMEWRHYGYVYVAYYLILNCKEIFIRILFFL